MNKKKRLVVSFVALCGAMSVVNVYGSQPNNLDMRTIFWTANMVDILRSVDPELCKQLLEETYGKFHKIVNPEPKTSKTTHIFLEKEHMTRSQVKKLGAPLWGVKKRTMRVVSGSKRESETDHEGTAAGASPTKKRKVS